MSVYVITYIYVVGGDLKIIMRIIMVPMGKRKIQSATENSRQQLSLKLQASRAVLRNYCKKINNKELYIGKYQCGVKFVYALY